MNPCAALLVTVSLAPAQAPSSPTVPAGYQPATISQAANAQFSTRVYSPLGGGFSQPSGQAALAPQQAPGMMPHSANVVAAGGWVTQSGPAYACDQSHQCGCGHACGCGHGGHCECEYELGKGGCLFGDDDDDVSCFGHRSTCDLYPHYAYAPTNHGYYYFRPYNYTHVLEHQQSVQRLGGDSRAPYATESFEGVYRSYMAGGYVEMPFPSALSPDYEEQRLPDLQQLLGR